MAVLRPVKLVITNYPEGQSETFEVENNPVHPEAGTHTVTFSRNLWIEADDFLPEPVPKYKRLYPEGPECRLKSAAIIRDGNNRRNIFCVALEPAQHRREPMAASNRDNVRHALFWLV